MPPTQPPSSFNNDRTSTKIIVLPTVSVSYIESRNASFASNSASRLRALVVGTCIEMLSDYAVGKGLETRNNMHLDKKLSDMLEL